LARRPDGVLRGSNAADFAAAAPSPGEANQQAREVAWVPGAQSLSPESPEPGAPCRLLGRLTNTGTQLVYEGEVGLSVLARDARGDTVAIHRGVVGRAMSSGDTIGVDLVLTFPARGKYVLGLTLALAGEPPARAGTDSLRLRVGAGPLALSEI